VTARQAGLIAADMVADYGASTAIRKYYLALSPPAARRMHEVRTKPMSRWPTSVSVLIDDEANRGADPALGVRAERCEAIADLECEGRTRTLAPGPDWNWPALDDRADCAYSPTCAMKLA
jgi:hypothetical protein